MKTCQFGANFIKFKMNNVAYVICIVLCFTAFTKAGEVDGADEVEGVDEDEEVDEVEACPGDQNRCFHFTWLGPHYYAIDREEINNTCLPVEYRGDGVPCLEPLVVTDGPGTPDMSAVMKNHCPTLTRRRVGNQVCAKYSFSFDGEVTNITYMVTRARFVSLHNYGPVTSGCYLQTVRGHQVEVCLCQDTNPNGHPCNTANHIHLFPALLCFLLFVIFSLYFENNLI